jgi:uncharacterized protein (TIGR03437 family)
MASAHLLAAAQGSSYTGSFAADDDKRSFYFSLTQSGTITLRTWSYAGGMNAAGATIPEGGFDPTISVFDANGNLVAWNRDGGCGTVAADSATSFCWDSYLALQLPAGSYEAVLTQSDNLPNGPTLAQSFVYDPLLCTGPLICPTDAQGNFTAAPGNAAPGFWDFFPSKRTASYALDIMGAASTNITTITSSATLPNAVINKPYSQFTFTAQSGPQATLTWSVASGTTLPPGLALSPSTGVLSGTPLVAGSYAFTVEVTDGIQASAPQTVTLVVYNPLLINAASLPSGVVGQPYSAGVTATGGSGNYSWSAGALPPGLGISPSGSISGTPTAPFAGSIFFSVIDSTAGLSASASVTLTISAPPLVLSGGLNLGDAALGASIAASYSASGGIPSYTWSLSGAPGLSVDSNGNVRGSTSQPGNFSPTLTVTDSAKASSSLTLSLAVLGISGSFPAGTTTSSYSGSAGGVGGAPPYSYSASGVPQGLSFSGGTLTGQVKTPGNYSIGVRVTDSNGVGVSENFSFTVTGPGPAALTIVTTTFPDAFAGQPYSQTLGAAGGASGYTWSQSGGQMPAGLSLSGATLSGTPTSPGSYTIGVQVSDTAGAQAVGTVTINIDPAPLEITSGATLPSGLVGVDYPAQILTATGGVPPYTFSVTGSLPNGLLLSNGQIAGTPGTAESFSFNLVVTDSAATPVTASLGAAVTIKPNAADLVLSSATASFALAAGTTATPSPSTIPVNSSAVSQVLTFTASSSVPWLTVGGSSSTPGSLAVGLNSAALSLSSTESPYAGTVTVSCTSIVCAGRSQTITVSLTVTAPPPQLSLGSPLLSFSALTSNPQSSSAALSILNAGGGSLAIQSVSADTEWISVGAFPPTVAPGPGGSVTITASPSGLSPGYYLGSVTVVSSAGSASVPVTLLLASSGIMTLAPGGTQFSMPQGGALGNSSGSFLVGISSGNVTFSASVLPGASWLSGGGTGAASPASPGTVSFSIDQSAASALPAGLYYGTIRVATTGAVDSPRDFQVVLSISPAATKVVPDPEPAGLLFISSGAALPPQTIQLFASSTSAIDFQTAASVIDGSGWLSVTPATGSTLASSPAQISVTASAADLNPGVYRGSVSFAFATSTVRTVNVTLIVEGAPGTTSDASPAGGSSNGKASPAASGSACAGAQLVPTQTGLVSNFSAPASWPTPLAITLVDTCGNPVGSAQIVTTFSNGDPPLVLSAIDTASGLYSATWTPRNTSSQVTILARASAPGYSNVTTQIAGQVAPNTVPVLAQNGTLDIFHPQVGAGLGPGNIVQIYGSGLAGQATAPAVLPLPTEVNGTSVIIGGVTAPLFYVSPGQINAQIPFELAAGNQYQLIVSANGALTTPQPIQLTPAVPAILQFNSGEVVAQHQDGTLIQDSSPAAPGEYVTIYLTGLGATDIAVPSGAPSPSSPLANVLDTPVVTLNDNQVLLQFAGLTPGAVGLYQINFQVPQPLGDGNYTLLIAQSGTVSNQTILPVMN